MPVAAAPPFRAARQGSGAGALALALALLWLAASSTPAQAHGTGSRWLDGQAAPLAVLFHYSTGEPMAWVSARVYGPGDTAMEYQTAHTDKAGLMAFVPDRPGAWRVEAQDDQGHKAVAETTVGADLVPAVQPGGQNQAASPLRSAALGVSLLLNLVLGLLLWRRAGAGKSPA